jgi:hypothetical protein
LIQKVRCTRYVDFPTIEIWVEGFLKASGLCRRHKSKVPNAGENADKEKNDSDFARARRLVLKRS